MWFGGTPAPHASSSDWEHHTVPHGTPHSRKRQDACTTTYIDDVNHAMLRWEEQTRTIDGIAHVEFALDSARVERTNNRCVALHLAITASLGDMMVTDQLAPIRVDNLRKRGIPYPWDLHLRVVCQSLAKAESDRLGVTISFQRIDRCAKHGAALHHPLAVFRYEGIFFDEEHTEPYEACVEISHLRSGHTASLSAPADKLNGVCVADVGSCTGQRRGGELFDLIFSKRKEEIARRKQERQAMWREDLASAVQGLRVPRFTRLVQVLQEFPSGVCDSPTALMHWLEGNTDKLKCWVSPPTALQLMRFRDCFSGYHARGRTGTSDQTLFAQCALAISGVSTERRRAALQLEAFMQHHSITTSDILQHTYTCFALDSFPLHGLKSQRAALDPEMLVYRLNRDCNDSVDARLELALEKTFGAWPFRCGISPWSLSAVTQFAYTFASCSRAPFVTGDTPEPVLEAVYKCLGELADAYEKQQRARRTSQQEPHITEPEICAREEVVCRYRAHKLRLHDEPEGPPEGVMPTFYDCDADAKDGSGSIASSDTDDAVPDCIKHLLVTVNAEPDNFVMRTESGDVQLHHSMRKMNAIWFGNDGREFRFRPRDWDGCGLTSMCFRTPFLWSFGIVDESMGAALQEHILWHGGALDIADETLTEFAIPLAAAQAKRRHSPTSHRSGACSLALGLRASPPHLVLLTCGERPNHITAHTDEHATAPDLA